MDYSNLPERRCGCGKMFKPNSANQQYCNRNCQRQHGRKAFLARKNESKKKSHGKLPETPGPLVRHTFQSMSADRLVKEYSRRGYMSGEPPR